MGFSFLNNILFFSYVCVCVHVYACVPCVCKCLHRPEDGTGCLGTGVTGGFKASNVGPLQEQQVLLAVESSLQPLMWLFLAV